MTTLLRMLRSETAQALRATLARPGFSALVIGVLAAGLACAIVAFALLDRLALRPLPFAAPAALYRAGLHDGGAADDIAPVSNPDVVEIRRRLAGLAEAGAAARMTMNLADGERSERVNGARISANLFRMLGVAPLLGRDFSDEDGRPGAPAVAILSYTLWQNRYGASGDVVGRTVRIDAQPVTVIGVMPAGFSFPRRELVWMAAPLDASLAFDHRAYWLYLRAQPGVAEAALQTAFAAWQADVAPAAPERFRGTQALVQPLRKLVLDDAARGRLVLLLAAVALVLLIACANAANLLLARTLGRRAELALRVALGASRARLAVQVLAQGLLLSLAAAVLALPLAHAVLRWQQQQMLQSEFSLLWLPDEVDGRVIALAFFATLATAFCSSIVPALHAARDAPAAALQDGGPRSAGSATFARISRVLVIGEIAASCALIVCVATLVRGIATLERADLGIDAAHVLTARVLLPERTYAAPADQARAYQRIGDRLRAEPGVVDASIGTALPGTYYNEQRRVLAEGEEPGDTPAPAVAFAAVDDHFRGAFGVVLVAGRFFDEHDGPDAPAVAVVDRRFVERYANGQPILGRRFRFEPRDAALPSVTVVGVVEPVLLDAPGRSAPPPSMLAPLRQEPFKVASIAVRTRGAADAFAPRLSAVLREVDPDVPPYWVRDYAQVMRSMSFEERTAAGRFALFGGVALLLAGAGLYGVMAFAVGRRLREIGVRRALGASRGAVLRALFARNFVQLGIGLAIGLALGMVFARQLTASLRFEQGGGAAIVFATVGVLVTAALLATIVPARRALRVDPVEALRHE